MEIRLPRGSRRRRRPAFRLLSTLQEVCAVKQLLPLPFESGELNSERLWKETRRAWGLRRQPPYRRRFFTLHPQTDRFHSSAPIGRRADSGAGETSGMKQQETSCSLKQAAGWDCDMTCGLELHHMIQATHFRNFNYNIATKAGHEFGYWILEHPPVPHHHHQHHRTRK